MTTAVDRLAGELRVAGERRATALLNDRVSRAFLVEDAGARMMALDFNARLVTELRERRIWPPQCLGRRA